MTNQELAEAITERFTPFAFKCDCEGIHPDCRLAMSEDVYAIAQADTVKRIVEFIKTQ